MMQVPRGLALPVAFALIGLLYLVATPIFEASDEYSHFGVIAYLHQTGELPVQDPDHADTMYQQEGSQPPLYYLLVAGLTAPFALEPLDEIGVLNPHARIGDASNIDNRNLFVHNTVPTAPRGVARVIYGVRALGLIFGMVTVTAVYLSARLIAPGTLVPFLAAGLVAFNPMFLFISASVNNDTLVTALNSLVIYLLIRTLRDGFDTRRSLWMALLMALATLTKLSGLVLVPVVALSALWIAYRRRDWRGLILLGAALAGLWAALAGWWYLRNIQLYGELFGTEMMVKIAGTRPTAFTLQTLIDEFEGFRVSFWGLFGLVNVRTFGLFYALTDALALVGVVGFAAYLVRMRRVAFQRLAGIVLLALFVVGSISLINWTAQTYASQGRLLFPFLAAISPMLALGWWESLRHLGDKRGAMIGRGAMAALMLVAWSMPALTIYPVYRLPEPLSALPDEAQAVYADFGAMALVGYATPGGRFTDGDLIPVTLYWQAEQITEADYSLFIHVIDPQGTVLGKIDTFPGGGQFRTSTWRTDGLIRGEYRVPVSGVGRVPIRLYIGWWDRVSGETLPAFDAQGQPLGTVALDAGAFISAEGFDTSAYTPVASAVFGDVIALRGYQLEGDHLSLLWESLGTPPPDLRVFVQVIDAAGTLAGQGDAPPELPTTFWRAGESFRSEHSIQFNADAPAGEMTVLVGWYTVTDFARLPIAAPDNAFRLTTFSAP